jgi:hypothetical protein
MCTVFGYEKKIRIRLSLDYTQNSPYAKHHELLKEREVKEAGILELGTTGMLAVILTIWSLPHSFFFGGGGSVAPESIECEVGRFFEQVWT